MEEVDADAAFERRRKRRRPEICIPPSQLVSPKSSYDGWNPPQEPIPELTAIWDLESERERQLIEERTLRSPLRQEQKHKIFNLSNFSIYRAGPNDLSIEFVPLHRLQVAHGEGVLFFDGVVGFGDVRRYIQRVPFSTVTLEDYGVDHKLWQICIQSVVGAPRDSWYSLAGKPAPEYRRYHEAFLWIAEFAKHFVDYLSLKSSIHLEDLRNNFNLWLHDRYVSDSRVIQWLVQHGKSDFREAFIAYSNFLWKETVSISPESKRHPIWKEADPRQLSAIEKEPFQEDKTAVTPYVYQCFEHMYFRDFLKPHEIYDPDIARDHNNRKADMGFNSPKEQANSAVRVKRAHKPSSANQVEVGSVIATTRDEASDWKDESNIWYAYVQEIIDDWRQGRDHQQLSVLWLYKPGDTVLSKGKYPWKNELFLSDNCNCGDAKLLASDALYMIDVEWFERNPDNSTPYFIRQKYCTQGGACSFRDLQEADFICGYRNQKAAIHEVIEKYQIGDSVLVKKGKSLEPCIVIDFRMGCEDVLVRRLERLERTDPIARPNELRWTENISPTKASNIIRRCYIRVYKTEQVPSPYNRNGAGDCYYISAQTLSDGTCSEPFGKATHTQNRLPFIEGFDPLEPIETPLQILDLFCGGGSLGRGVEECGVGKIKCGIDIDIQAIHTWRANTKSNDAIAYWGSVNDCLVLAMAGSNKVNVLRIGAVDIILSGSPCPGFSLAQSNKQSDRSKRNASLVASVIAYIDFYRPRFGMIENVPGMAGDIDGQNVFAQVLCALVGMGYQTKHHLLDAWSHGDAQSRSRIFIVIAAPGLQRPESPALTHSHPAKTRAVRLGTAVDGTPFGQRQFEEAYAFGPVTARDAIGDLPDVEDSHVEVCVPFPDHRPSRTLSIPDRCCAAMIPTLPYGMDFTKALAKGVIAQPLFNTYKERKKYLPFAETNYWRRVNPNELLSTVTTWMSPWDFKTGRCLHWSQHRLLTVMELRRAQGIPDDEVLIGLPAAQHKIAGNGVARKIAVALGIPLREAWLGSMHNGRWSGVRGTRETIVPNQLVAN